MNILHVIPAYLPATSYGGPVRSVHELCKSLVHQGHSVTVFATNFDGLGTTGVPLNRPCIIDGVTVYYFKVKFPLSYFRSSDLKKFLKIKVNEFDLVHIHTIYSYTTLVAARYARQFNIPYIISPRGMLDKGAIGLKGSFKKTLYLRLFERKVFINAALTHYTSVDESDQSYFSKITEKKLVIPNGIDIKRYQSAPDKSLPENYSSLHNKKIVFFLGRLNYIKGLDILVQSWPKVIAEYPDAHLVIAGPDNDGYKKNVVAIIDLLKISDSITFTGELDFSDKITFLKASEMLVAPSYLESFGMSIVEAMACAKPVIVSNKVNISPIIGHYNAGIISSCDSSEFGSAIVKMLGSQEGAAVKGNNASRLVTENFELDTVTGKMISAYGKLVLENKAE